MSTDPPLEGTCKLRPGPIGDPVDSVAAEYAALADEYGPRNVLVLKRHPAGLERMTTELSDVAATTGSPRSPRVESVPEHASKVVEEFDPTLDRLEYEERIELISLVIDGTSRDVPAYIERASTHESFVRDVGQLLLEATRQGIRLDALESGGESPHDCLAFLYAINDRFHEEIASRGYVERADVIPRAVEVLEANVDGLRTRVTDSVDAVLAVEFEEYRRLDRRYLAALSEDADLVCLGERHASVERTRVETGRIEDVVGDGLEIETLEETTADDGSSGTSGKGRSGDRAPHDELTRFLATGESTAGRSGRAKRIRTRTERDQIRAVATEIRSLRERHGWRYDEFAVAVPRIERVPETRRALREAGVPTATIGTPSLAEDPAVNELYAFVTVQCERARGGVETDRYDRRRDDDHDAALERLRARVDDFSPALLETCSGTGVSRSLARWILETDLKGRIAATEEWVDAREQYEGVRRVLEIARFVEETDLVGPDWRGLRRMLRRTIRYDAPYVHTVDARAPTGGVAVRPIEDLKYDSREVVFVLDLIDEIYPGEQFLTQLFPTAWLRELSTYPAVTDLSPAAVDSTFAPPSSDDGVGTAFERYHAQRSRRRLALGSRAAQSVLYCCSYERGSGGLRRTHDESRYLTLIDSTPGLELEDVTTDATSSVRGATSAVETILEQPHGELERVLREASTGGEADLGETEALFCEIALVLEGEIDPDLAAAIRSQFEFAAGEVIRDE
ncbi:hypothetical protein [Natrialba sp. INN-245]|uniref:hypothetical protein n=1 Tax=Natrialba sp. INN-245 TaxID=2690967 RepID=UPI0013130228|nr:hypothetical protein [Natrialba sp. INN-245]MWV40899.1 hypothetical protein [Natrialba sp. INN-245]